MNCPGSTLFFQRPRCLPGQGAPQGGGQAAVSEEPLPCSHLEDGATGPVLAVAVQWLAPPPRCVHEGVACMVWVRSAAPLAAYGHAVQKGAQL